MASLAISIRRFCLPFRSICGIIHRFLFPPSRTSDKIQWRLIVHASQHRTLNLHIIVRKQRYLIWINTYRKWEQWQHGRPPPVMQHLSSWYHWAPRHMYPEGSNDVVCTTVVGAKIACTKRSRSIGYAERTYT